MAKKRATTKARRKKGGATARKRPARPRNTRSSTGRARSVVVTVDASHVPTIAAIAAKLRAKGMSVDAVLDATGMITGRYAKPSSTLRRIPGVAGVEDQPHIQLPPPDSDVQ
jgi:hypothetical protein